MAVEFLMFGPIVNDVDLAFYKFFYGEDAAFTSPGDFKKFLDKADGDDISILINSPGGDADAGIAISNLVQTYKGGQVTASIIGMAASAAGVVAAKAPVVEMADNAGFMIHGIQLSTFGTYNIRDLDNLLSMAQTYNSQVATTFASRTKTLDKDAWITKFDEGKDEFLTAEDALSLGLVDRIIGPSDEKIEIPESDRVENTIADRIRAVASVQFRKRLVGGQEKRLARKEQELKNREKALSDRERLNSTFSEIFAN